MSNELLCVEKPYTIEGNKKANTKVEKQDVSIPDGFPEISYAA